MLQTDTHKLNVMYYQNCFWHFARPVNLLSYPKYKLKHPTIFIFEWQCFILSIKQWKEAFTTLHEDSSVSLFFIPVFQDERVNFKLERKNSMHLELSTACKMR